jgi:hypothetical protein
VLLVVLALGAVLIYTTHGGHPMSLSDRVGQLFGKQHGPSVKDSLAKIESALKSHHLDQAEDALAALKDAALKDSKVAELEVQLVSAKIGRALSDGHLDKAKELLDKAKKSGAVAAEQLKSWEEQIRSAEKSSSSTSSAAGTP